MGTNVRKSGRMLGGLQRCWAAICATLLFGFPCAAFYSGLQFTDNGGLDGRGRVRNQNKEWSLRISKSNERSVRLFAQQIVEEIESDSKCKERETSLASTSPESRKRKNFAPWQRPVRSSQQHLLSPYMDVQLPPWLSRYYSSNNQYAVGSDGRLLGDGWKHYSQSRVLEDETKRFEYLLLEKHGFLIADVNDIIEVIYASARAGTASLNAMSTSQETSRTGTILGIIDYLNLVLDTLTIETDFNTAELKPTKEILVASVLHYVECTVAQLQGATEIVKNALLGWQGTSKGKELLPALPRSRHLPTDVDESVVEIFDEEFNSAASLPCLPLVSNMSCRQNIEDDFPSVKNADMTIDDLVNAQHVILISPQSSSDELRRTTEGLDFSFGSKPTLSSELQISAIAQGASRIARAEILVQALADTQRAPALNSEEAARIRGLLLTIDCDWRSLALRCVACLFRLNGILETIPSGVHEYQSINDPRSSEIVRTAREGLRVYATLAEQLGLHRLKTQLEDRAFRILYRRQYAAVLSLFKSTDCEQNQVLQKVAEFLQGQVQQVLSQDDSLMSHLEHVEVTTRVKEPYSFWRKLLKSKSGRVAPTRSSEETIISGSFLTKKRRNLSVTDVHDTVALRVVLRGRKWIQDEPDEVTRAREEVICYYVQELLLQHWPALDPKRTKDYIRNPKPNGYKSLHFTAQHKSSKTGCTFPFEVQIRSEDMHETAEYGVASHWGYKLGPLSTPSAQSVVIDAKAVDKNTKSIPSCSHTEMKAEERSVGLLLDPLSTADDRSRRIFSNSYLDALEVVRLNMVRQQVYVFTTTAQGRHCGDSAFNDAKGQKGRLLTLPVNSRVRDVLVAMNCDDMNSNVTLTAPQVIHNGRVASMETIVVNGDILMIQL